MKNGLVSLNLEQRHKLDDSNKEVLQFGHQIRIKPLLPLYRYIGESKA